MAKISERVHLMMENFMTLHNEGYTIQQIAEKFNLCFSTVYNHLDEIAANNRVSRESLLQVVQKTHSYWVRETKKVQTDADELIKTLDIGITDCEAVLEEIKALNTII